MSKNIVKQLKSYQVKIYFKYKKRKIITTNPIYYKGWDELFDFNRTFRLHLAPTGAIIDFIPIEREFKIT